MKDPYNMNMKKITDPISDKTNDILKRLSVKKKGIQLDNIIDTLNKYIGGAVKLSNPLNVAENLHKGNYIERVNNSQLWVMKRFYELVNYDIGLIDVGNKFLSQKNYHGAFETFHSTRYSQGLIELTKRIVDEVKIGNRDNIGYAKKALVDIVNFEGNKNVKEYINTIADAYIAEYKSLLKHHTRHNAHLYDALELYRLNNNKIGITKTAAKIAYHRLAHHKDTPYVKNVPIENHFDS